jgi:hypothetical protein
MAERRANPWMAFAAGAVAMLAAALLWFAWQGRDDAVEVVAAVASALPDIQPTGPPRAPRLPDAPIPIPK